MNIIIVQEQSTGNVIIRQEVERATVTGDLVSVYLCGGFNRDAHNLSKSKLYNVTLTLSDTVTQTVEEILTGNLVMFENYNFIVGPGPTGDGKMDIFDNTLIFREIK